MNAKSRKSIKPTKTAAASTESTQAVRPVKPVTAPDEVESNLVRIHDLTGFAAICVPVTLRELIGEEAYKRYISNVELHELTLILREPNDVVYIRMSVMHCLIAQGISPSPDPVKTPAGKGAKVNEKAKGKPAAKPSSTTSRKPRPSL